METNAKNLRLKAKQKLLSMSSCVDQSSRHSSPVSSDNNDHNKPVSTLSDDEKVNKILLAKSVEQKVCSDELIANVLKLISHNMPFGVPLASLINVHSVNHTRGSLLDVSNIKDIVSLMLSTRQISIYTIDGISRVFINSEKNVTHISTHGYNIFEDIVWSGDRLRPLNVTISDSIDVKVTHIVDPLNIWIQIKKDKSDTVFQELSEDLQFYNSVDLEKWRVPQQFLCVGLPVITCHLSGNNCWQRACVTEIHDLHVTVTFVDFGGITKLSIHNIYLMKRQFLTQPVQALRVGLFGVNHLIGKNFHWSSMLTDKLRSILSMKNYIRCEFIEKISDDYYYVHLFDRKNLFLDSDLFVNDFIRNRFKCLCRTKHVLNDKNCKSINIDNQSTIRSMSSVTMNISDLRLEAKKKLLSMSSCVDQSSQQSSSLVSDSNDHKPVSTLSDKEKVNLNLIAKSSVKKMCSDELIANILKLISSNMPFGIPVSSISDAYNTNYNSDSLHEASDINDFLPIMDLLWVMLSMGQIYIQKVDNINRVFINNEKEPTNGNCFIKNLFGYNILNDIVCPGDHLRDMVIPLNATLEINKCIDVRVTYIKDPLNIWIQIKNDKSDTALPKLLEDLQFYNGVDLEKWRVPQQFLCVGLPVIVFCAGNNCLQRACVTEIHAFTVTVCFVDYGGFATPSINNVYLMKRQFLSLPAQALRVGLFCVNHLNEKNFRWPVSLIYKLRCILLTHNSIRCNFIQKISDNFYFVSLFDWENMFADLNALLYDFFRNNIVCSHQSGDVVNVEKHKSIENDANHSAIRSTISVNMNLIDFPPLPSVASVSTNGVNLDQILTESVQCDEQRKLVAPVIPQQIHSISSESYANIITKKVNNKTVSSLCSSAGIRKLKPNIKISFSIDIERKTVSNIDHY